MGTNKTCAVCGAPLSFFKRFKLKTGVAVCDKCYNNIGRSFFRAGMDISAVRLHIVSNLEAYIDAIHSIGGGVTKSAQLADKSAQLADKSAQLADALSKSAQLEADLASLAAYPILELDRIIAKKNSVITSKTTEVEQLEATRLEMLSAIQKLQSQSNLYREVIELSEYGVYEPHFDFDTSDKYKQKILEIKEKQKTAIKNGTACYGGEGFTYNGSQKEGQSMVSQQKKIMLRAFNGECDSFIAAVNWKNSSQMEERIKKSFETINKMFNRPGISINNSYKYLKLKELWLASEYQEKKQAEKEEQQAIRAQIKEEEKVAKEIENARIKAEQEEQRYQKEIEKTKAEAEQANGENHDNLMLKIQELEAKLQEAEANKERALSMAQQTKRGHVYIISNIGSFGDDVYKIGMTRRLEPLDRVKELGDASVPFAFDVHAVIFSENAPQLEHDLHQMFDNRRLNLINNKKEFFKVSLAEIEAFIKENCNADIQFTKLAEAKEYRETLALQHKTD